MTKVDLLPWIDFNMAEFQRLVRSLNPDIRIFQVSCVTGEGMAEWVNWLLTLTQAS